MLADWRLVSAVWLLGGMLLWPLRHLSAFLPKEYTLGREKNHPGHMTILLNFFQGISKYFAKRLCFEILYILASHLRWCQFLCQLRNICHCSYFVVLSFSQIVYYMILQESRSKRSLSLTRDEGKVITPGKPWAHLAPGLQKWCVPQVALGPFTCMAFVWPLHS